MIYLVQCHLAKAYALTRAFCSLTDLVMQLQGTFTESGPHKDDPKARELGMKPHLQIMCGPMLRFDTLENGIWHGFAMVVTSMAGSVYEPKPYISWRVGRGESSLEEDMQHKATLNGSSAPSSAVITGTKIFEYHGISGTNDFWRFKFEIPMGQHEQPVTYSLNVSRLHLCDRRSSTCA